MPPHRPPFTTNVSVAIDHDASALPAYTASLARRAGGHDPFQKATPRAAGGKPALVLAAPFSHQDLKLVSVQALVDASPFKLVVTATALEQEGAGAQGVVNRLLDSLKVTRRAPLPLQAGTSYRDADGRFALALPQRFGVNRSFRGPELAVFVGPIEKGVPITGRVEDLPVPPGWAATEDRLAVMRRGIPGDRSARWMLDGKVLRRKGQPDALVMKLRDYPGELEMNEVAVEQIVNGRLYRASFRGTAMGFELYEAALRASLETFLAPAPK